MTATVTSGRDLVIQATTEEEWLKINHDENGHIVENPRDTLRRMNAREPFIISLGCTARHTRGYYAVTCKSSLGKPYLDWLTAWTGYDWLNDAIGAVPLVPEAWPHWPWRGSVVFLESAVLYPNGDVVASGFKRLNWVDALRDPVQCANEAFQEHVDERLGYSGYGKSPRYRFPSHGAGDTVFGQVLETWKRRCATPGQLELLSRVARLETQRHEIRTGDYEVYVRGEGTRQWSEKSTELVGCIERDEFRARMLKLK